MRVSALYVYPVKACRAVALDDAALGVLGLENDRRFAFLAEDGCALTQRDQPLLATVSPFLDADAIRLDLGGLAQLAIPLAAFTQPTRADVWGNQIGARAAPASLVTQAADYLGERLRLVTLDAEPQRAFVDSRPVLVATADAISKLNGHLPTAVGMERFRPNVVLEGSGDWRALEGSEIRLERDKPCGRCEVTTIDQASGARRGPEPLRTLSERFEGNFGVYCRVARAGRLRRGELLTGS
jgi:uncharacterized protein YcbX